MSINFSPKEQKCIHDFHTGTFIKKKVNITWQIYLRHNVIWRVSPQNDAGQMGQFINELKFGISCIVIHKKRRSAIRGEKLVPIEMS